MKYEEIEKKKLKEVDGMTTRKKIIELLKEEALTLEDISDKVGVSIQRVSTILGEESSSVKSWKLKGNKRIYGLKEEFRNAKLK